MAKWSIGIDTGGTFTDLAAVDHESGDTYVAKVPSTPADPAEAIQKALERFSADTRVPLHALSMLGHGTTVATNAVLEGKGAKAGLLITAGFRAVYPARAGTRPRGRDLIDPAYQKADPLIPQSLTYEIPERLGPDGAVRRPLDRAAVCDAARKLKAAGCRSVAICFLFSYVNGAHEREAAEIIRAAWPEARLSLSSEILPVIREFPRLSTVAIDAYVGPIVGTYFTELGGRLRDRDVKLDRVFIMQSNGGLMRLNLAAAYPNETLLSGPAAGIAFSSAIAANGHHHNVVTFDMGGTSTDICLVRNGLTTTVNSGTIAGQAIGTSMIEIRTIGAGGGAIAHRGDDGLLKVGPESAGAHPGPACYGRGGSEPTVTDANALLGYIDVERLLGGELRGNSSLAERSLAALGEQFGMNALEAAIGVRRVVNAHMAAAVRLNLSEKGCDPRSFSLLAFGGCGPLHAADIAADLGIRRVIVPAHPGVSCAMGLLLSDVKHVYLRSVPRHFSDATADELNDAFAGLEDKARTDIAEEGFDAADMTLTRHLDVRYARQGYQLTIDAPDTITQDDIPTLRRRFDRVHQDTYGVSAPDEEAEIVTVRLIALVRLPRMPLAPKDMKSGLGEPIGRRQAYFVAAGGLIDTPIYNRGDLGPGGELTGPAIVEQLDATTMIGPGQRMSVDDIGNLVIETA